VLCRGESSRDSHWIDRPPISLTLNIDLKSKIARVGRKQTALSLEWTLEKKKKTMRCEEGEGEGRGGGGDSRKRWSSSKVECAERAMKRE
jgi:hypothetical protein